MLTTVSPGRDALVAAARADGETLVRLRAEAQRDWDDLFGPGKQPVASDRDFVLKLSRYEQSSFKADVALIRFRAQAERLGRAGHTPEYLAITSDVYDRLQGREPIGVDMAPGFVFTGGPS